MKIFALLSWLGLCGLCAVVSPSFCQPPATETSQPPETSQLPETSHPDARSLVVDGVQALLIEDVLVPAEVAGKLSEISVREGDIVNSGDLLARIDDQVARHLYRGAELEHEKAVDDRARIARLETAKKRLELAKETRDRLKILRARSPTAVSFDEQRNARLALIEAEAEAKLADHELRAGELVAQVAATTRDANLARLEQHRITAPIAGIIVERIGKPGQWIKAGEPAVRIVNLRRLRLEAFISSARYDSRLTGAPVEFRALLPGETEPVSFHGEVTFVSPIVEALNGEVRLWAEVQNPTLRLRPGTVGDLHIQTPNSIARP